MLVISIFFRAKVEYFRTLLHKRVLLPLKVHYSEDNDSDISAERDTQTIDFYAIYQQAASGLER